MFTEEESEEKRYNPDPIIWIYTLSSVLSLMLAFSDSMGPMRSANCLVISWLFAFGAIGISVLYDSNENSPQEQ